MQTGEAGKTLIKEVEKFVPTAYMLKGEDFYTIGYGHYGADVKKGEVWTKAQAEAQFKIDLRKYEVPVNGIKVPLNQNEYDALVSFSYNEGVNALPTSTLAKKLNAGDRIGASNEFKNWTRSSNPANRAGLLIRRMKEKKLFLTPVKKTETTDKNQDAVNKAKAQKDADAKAQKLLQDKLKADNIRKELAEKDAIAKAKLSKDKIAIAKAEATAKANAIARANAIAKSKSDAKAKADALALKNAYNSNNPSKNNISNPKDAKSKTLPVIGEINKSSVLKGGFSILGLFLVINLMNSIDSPQTELE